MGNTSKSTESAVVKDDFFVSSRDVQYIATVPKMVTFSYHTVNLTDRSSNAGTSQDMSPGANRMVRVFLWPLVTHVDRLSFNIGVNFFLTEAIRLYQLLLQ